MTRPSRAQQHSRAAQGKNQLLKLDNDPLLDLPLLLLHPFHLLRLWLLLHLKLAHRNNRKAYLRVWNPARPVYDSVGGGRGIRLDLDVMIHMRLIEKVGDSYQVVGSRDDSSDDEEAEDAGDANMEEGNPTPFGPSFDAGTSGAGPSFQGMSSMSNDEVLAQMMSRMDMFDTRLNGMESMIADRFQSIEIMHRSLDSRMDTLQGQLHAVIQLLQPQPPPPPES
ncbi:hypothetical protein JCGZ_11200 [Jatropha curcas]|uniref:Uncharacterized protein n=1 Tax=Jatropha curcas TaxID=180498 RepID=A0A067KIL7_JATCU|nr:hypothetical protein JCGZ_11200 [Jatropha curcas]